MQSVKQLFKRSRSILVYAFSLAVLVFMLKWMQYKYLIVDYSIDIYVGLIALFFTAFGIWIATQLSNFYQAPANVSELKEPIAHIAIDVKLLEKYNFTNREYEVLQQISKGYSNSEIAENLFLSLSTIKTHASNLYSKLEVKRRTQAIEKAKRLKILP